MQPIRKPRIFLSHSKRDIDFIRRIEADLRLSQCEPWIDEVEMRPGQPWLDQIFTSGIPSCEVVLCYFTESSTESEVFMQELDARLIERLHNSRVSLLPYVSSAEIRAKLRLDLQRLQVPVLNSSNYTSEFPRLVAEVWRLYSETLVLAAIDAERVKRLEAELRVKELEEDASMSIFTASEHAEFKAIWAQLNKKLILHVVVDANPKTVYSNRTDGDPENDQNSPEQQSPIDILLDYGQLFRAVVLKQRYEPSATELFRIVKKHIIQLLDIDQDKLLVRFEIPVDLEADLLKFGFVERYHLPPEPQKSPEPQKLPEPQYLPEPQELSMHKVWRDTLWKFRTPLSIMIESISIPRREFKLVFTTKFDRFTFWTENSFGEQQPETGIVARL